MLGPAVPPSPYVAALREAMRRVNVPTRVSMLRE
jgi:hypothetical protein